MDIDRLYEAFEQRKIRIGEKDAIGYVIPLGPANLVAAVTGEGMIGCGAFDVGALDAFGYPAARVRPSAGPSIRDLGDLMDGIVREANRSAIARGIKEGMQGSEALGFL